MTDDFELTRRKALAALGSIGVASAGAGLGTSAYFSDQETFENNQLTAGTLDMKVSWAEHYSDWSEDEADFASMEDGELVVQDREGFMDATLQEQYPDDETRAAIETGEADPCEVLADVPDDLGGPVIDLSDVKPGDFGEVTFDFTLCDNPGYVWLTGSLLDASENGVTEPEADDPDEREGVVELLDEIRVTVWYDSGDNVLDDPETIVTDREFEPNPISSSIAVSGEDRLVTQGTLREVLTQLSVENGIPLDADPTTDGRDCYTNSPTVHYVGFNWELPVDHANEIQSDSVEFDLGFYTEQCRHNDGVGLSTDLEAYYPLDGNTEDSSGNEYDGTSEGDVSFGSGKIGDAGSFDAEDYIEIPGVIDASAVQSRFAWVKPSGGIDGGYPRVIHQSNDLELAWKQGSNEWGVYNGSNWYTFGTAPSGEWKHVGVVWDGTNLIGYENGQSNQLATNGGSSSTAPIRIGANPTPDGDKLAGQIDDVRIYSRALSASEVQSLYESA